MLQLLLIFLSHLWSGQPSKRGSIFQTKRKESLGAAWARFNDLVNFGPDLAIQDHMLLQHFYMGLSGETAQLLDTSSEGAFLHCSASDGRNILRKILENTPYTNAHDDSPEDIVEEKPVIVDPEPLTTPLEASTDLKQDPRSTRVDPRYQAKSKY